MIEVCSKVVEAADAFSLIRPRAAELPLSFALVYVVGDCDGI